MDKSEDRKKVQQSCEEDGSKLRSVSPDKSVVKHKSPVFKCHFESKLEAQDSMEGINWHENQFSPVEANNSDQDNDDILDLEIPGSKERSRSVTFAASLDVEDPRKRLQRTPTPYWAESCDVDDAELPPVIDDSQKSKTPAQSLSVMDKD